MKKLVCKTPNCQGTIFTKSISISKRPCVKPLGEWEGYVCARCGKVITREYEYAMREVMIPKDAIIDRFYCD